MSQTNNQSTALTVVENKTCFFPKRNYVFENICSKTQAQLKKFLKKKFSKVEGMEAGDGYLYVPGTVPILLVAHMDTVHAQKPTEFVYSGVDLDEVSSPTGIGGDDRCGVYMILEILKKHNCHVLFAEDEERGCIGTGKFILTELAASLVDKFQYVIELDRKGSKDAVFYECDNPEFTNFITEEYWVEDWGSYTDICDLCPFLKAAGVNFSCGYYAPHTTNEYVNLTEMHNNINEVCKLIARTTEADKYEFIEAEWNYNSWFSKRYGSKYDDYTTGQNKLKSKFQGFGGGGYAYIITYVSPYLNAAVEREVRAWSEEEAVGKLLISLPDCCFNDIISVVDGVESKNEKNVKSYISDLSKVSSTNQGDYYDDYDDYGRYGDYMYGRPAGAYY